MSFKPLFPLVLFLMVSKFSLSQQRISEEQSKMYIAEQFSTSLRTEAARPYLVKTDNPSLILSNEKVEVLKRLSYQDFIIKADESLLSKLQLKENVRSNSLWKASDNLIALLFKNPKKTVNMTIFCGSRNSNGAGRRYRLKMNRAQLRKILEADTVVFADLTRKARPESAISDLNLNANAIGAIHFKYPDLTGSNTILSLKEDMYNTGDLDLLGKQVLNNNASSIISSHATIMATMIAGLGNTFYNGLGCAPDAKISSSNFANLSPDTVTYFSARHIVTQNHSYGTDIENYYGPEARAYDDQVYNLDTICHVFSSGNIGNSTPLNGVYAAVPNSANLTGNFKQAKNVFVIGGTDKYNFPVDLSSRGPSYDGRIKPEIVAAGEDGTSGSAALTTGVITLMQEAYLKKFGKSPSSSLIKSALITSADKVYDQPLSYISGFGSLNGLEAVRIIEEGNFFSGILQQGETLDLPLPVPDSTSQLKVTLTWNDPPAQINAPIALVNDLDLSIITPAQTKYLPWQLSSFPNADSLARPATRGIDVINNVEHVTINTPSTGKYLLHLSGQKMKSSRQSYSITYSIEKQDSFQWIYPYMGSKVISGNETLIYWKSSFKQKNASLSASYDGGITWTKISDVSIDAGQFSWYPPKAFTNAILKMKIDDSEYTTKTFAISSPLNIHVGYVCSDNILLFWNKQMGSTAYTIYTIKNNALQPVATSIDTFIVIPVKTMSSNFFAVSATGVNGLTGEKSRTVDISTQGVSCYYKAFYAVVNNAKQGSLSLQVSTTLNLKEIIWQKLMPNNTYQQIGSTPVQNAVLNYNLIDPNLKMGIQYYRVVLKTKDDIAIATNTASLLNTEPGQFAIYPNPCNDKINVISDGSKTYEIKICDMLGLQRIQETISENSHPLVVNSLPSGTYIATIYAKDSQSKIYSFKLIKL